MYHKLVAILLILAICSVPFVAMANIAPPITLGAPEHFAVGHYYGSQVYFTLSAPEELRDYIERRAAGDPIDKQNFSAHCQFDYKIDNGGWHYTKEWDSLTIKHKNILYAQMSNGKNYLTTYGRESLSALFPEDSELKAFSDVGWDYLQSHKITFRARFFESFDNGETNVTSDWSNEYTLSANLKADTEKLINNAPTLISADLKTDNSGMPYFDIKSDRIPGPIMDLHGMTGGSVRTEIWMRRLEDKDFKLIKYDWANLELFHIEADDYFDGEEQSFEAQSYEIKVRYALDLRKYKQAGIQSTTTVDIYSPFSNVISHNMPAWSKASSWATEEIKKAVDNGLYPEKFKGADLTKPITRAEFASVALKLYESFTGNTAAPAPVSTFTDTKDIDVLKSFALDIVLGVGNNKFAPDELISREQAATMLTRVYKKVNWEDWTLADDNTYTKHSLDNKGVLPFADDAKISDYAKPSVYFMAKYGIIKGSGNNIFAPKNTTSAEVATGYANATREQALAISNRTFETVDVIKDGGPIAEITSIPTKPEAPTQDNKDMNEWLIGFWGYSDSAGGLDLSSRVYIDYMIEFKADGTFLFILSSMWKGSRTATAFEGKYGISGDKLILSEQLKSTGGATTTYDGIWYLAMDSYETRNIAYEDKEYTISRTSEGTLMIDDKEYQRGLSKSNPLD